MKPSKWVIICCPVSGKKVGQSLMETVFIPRMTQLAVPVEMKLTTSAGHATQLAKEHGSEDCGLVVVGGDGTLHEVLDGLIAADKLKKVRLAILSQGTMNAYFHSACLPDVKTLPDNIARGDFRVQSLMKMKDDSGKIDTMCFEAVYMGVGYKPAKGAQEFRHSFAGPFFGIMYNLFKACMFPKGASIKGTLTLYPRNDPNRTSSEKIEVTDTFYWIVISQRSPYNGALEADRMWVSYITLKSFPGFGRTFSGFAPPMEFMSGLTNLMEEHIAVSKVTFKQTEGNLGVCLDGDPIEGGTLLTAEHLPAAWNIVADPSFPTRVSDDITKVRPPTKCAKAWLEKHPVPDGTYKPDVKATKNKRVKKESKAKSDSKKKETPKQEDDTKATEKTQEVKTQATADTNATK